MQSANLGNFDYSAKRGRLDRSADRRIFVQREVRSRIFVVLEIVFQDAAQSGFIEDDDVVQAFATNRTEQPLDIRIWPGAPRRGLNFLNAHPFGSLGELPACTLHRGRAASTVVRYPKGRLPEVAARSIRRSDER
jgi:hypothetical protein